MSSSRSLETPVGVFIQRRRFCSSGISSQVNVNLPARWAAYKERMSSAGVCVAQCYFLKLSCSFTPVASYRDSKNRVRRPASSWCRPFLR